MSGPCQSARCRQRGPHRHPTLGLGKASEEEFVIFDADPKVAVCAPHSEQFDLSVPANGFVQHVYRHMGLREIPLPVPKGREFPSPPAPVAGAGTKMPKKGEKKSESKKESRTTPVKKEKAKGMAKPPAEKPSRPKERIFSSRTGDDGKTVAVKTYFPKEHQEKVMSRDKLGSSYGEFVRQAWESRPENPHFVAPGKPLVSRFVFFPVETADEIVKAEKGGFDFDGYIWGRIASKLGI